MLFNVTFNLDAEKRKIINKAIRKNRLKITPKKLLIILIILIVSGFFVWNNGPQAGASFFSIFALPYVLINIFALYEHKTADYKLFRCPTTFSLYEDRIEIIENPTEEYKGTFEKVYPLSSVSAFSEYNDFLIVSFDNGDNQFLMKSDLTEEQLNLLTSKIKK